MEPLLTNPTTGIGCVRVAPRISNRWDANYLD